jgi:hypothetical protein
MELMELARDMHKILDKYRLISASCMAVWTQGIRKSKRTELDPKRI